MKTKIRLMALVAGLLSILPTTSAWAGGSTTTYYYGALKAAVSSTGGGKVYAATSNSTPSSDKYVTTDVQSAQNKSESKSMTFYAFAQANEGYEFGGWATSDGGAVASTDNPYAVSVTASSTTDGSPTVQTVYALFTKKLLAAFGITFETSAGGAYTVDGKAPANKTGLTEATTVKLASSDPNFLNWKVNGAIVNGNPYDLTCIAATTVSAEFLTADQVAEATTYDELTAALANDGKKKITIPAGTKIQMDGGEIAVPEGKQLVIDGELWIDSGTVKGTVIVNGTLSKCTKRVVQQGQSEGVPFNPYGTAKYWKTSVSTPSISLPSGVTAQSHATVINGYGETFRTVVTSSTRVLTVSRDTTVAANHITKITGASESKNLTGSSVFVLLTADCIVNGGLTSKTGFGGVVDCAGNNCSTVSGVEVSGNNGAATFFNCPSFTVSKSVGTTHTFYNCQKVTVSSLNAGNPCGNSFYDCGPTVSISYNKGPATGTYANFYSGTYDSIPSKTQVIYGGRYKTNPGTEGAYLASGKSLRVKQEDGYYVVYEHIAVNVAEVDTGSGVQSFETLQEAFDAIGNGQTIRLVQNYGGDETATIADDKNFSLDLRGYSLTSASGKIVNNGTLWIKDSSTQDATKETSVINWAIANNGTLTTTYGTYKGDFTLNAGSKLVTHCGRFLNRLVLGAGVSDPASVADLRGGYFSMDLASAGFLSQSYLQKDQWIGKFPYAVVEEISVDGYEKAWAATSLPVSDLTIYAKDGAARPLPRAEYESDADWCRRAELESMLKPYSGTIDCTMSFDRPVEKETVKAYAYAKISINETLDRAMAANEVYRVLITKLVELSTPGTAMIGYDRFLTGYDFSQEAKVGVAAVNGANAGTVAKLELEVCQKSDRHLDPSPEIYVKDYALATCRYMLGGKKAAIDRDNGRVAFDSLTEAVAAAQNGETILLGADCAENVTLEKVGTFTIDPYGFKFTGSVSIGEGLEEGAPATTSDSLVVAQDVSSAPATTYVLKLSNVTVGIPAVANTTLAVTASEGEVTDLGNGQYQVSPGATVTATYTPNEGFFGEKIVKTIESATAGASVTVSDDEAASVKAIVAKIGETPYASLGEAVAAAESGATIDVVKESTLTVVEGVELTVTSGQLVAAIPEDNVLELKDGTDVTLAWPTADGAAEHIIVTGGRYSADPSAFLAEGLEAKKVGEKYVVGVKIVSGDTETETIVTTEKQESKVEKLEETEKAEVFKDVDAEKVVEVVEKIEQSTKVEGVKLTVVSETEQNPAGIVAVVEEATKQDEDFAAAVKSAAEVSVKVEVEVKPTEYVAPSEQAQSNTGKVAFKLTPKATVTVKQDVTELKQVVPVTNDMIDQNQKIAVSIYTGFRPSTILHNDDNGALIESFTGEQIVYDAENGVSTVQISHFSTLLASQEEIDVERELLPETVRETATKVTSGFYQNATTYQDATEFYITSKDGFHAFRDLINQDNGVIEDYIDNGFWKSTADQFYTTNPFTGKTVKLLCDVDEEDVTVKPIGMTAHSRSDGKDKRFFYGAFDGCNHKISNLRVIDDPATAKHRVGLFGNVTRNGNDTGIYNLTIENAYITGYNYVGGFIGGVGGAVAVTNCHLIGSVTLAGTQYVGGIIGHVGDGVDSQVMDCSVQVSNGSTLTSNQAGGIVGYMGGGDIRGCAVKGLAIKAKSSRVIGGIAGSLITTGSVVENCVVDSVTITALTTGAAGSVIGSFGGVGVFLLNNTVVNTHVYEPGPVEIFAQCQYIASGDTTSIVGWGIEWDANEKIIAGTFERIDDNAIATGYEKVALGTTPETWKVQKKAVCRIGETKYCSLQAAVAEVKAGETIVALTGTLDFAGVDASKLTGVTIRGLVDADGKAATVAVTGSSEWTTEGVTYANLKLDTFYYKGSNNVFDNCSIAYRLDGSDGVNVTVKNCTFDGTACHGTYYTTLNGTVSISNCTFNCGKDSDGFAIHFAPATSGKLVVEDCELVGKYALGANVTAAEFTRCNFNDAADTYAAFMNFYNKSVVFTSCHFSAEWRKGKNTTRRGIQDVNAGSADGIVTMRDCSIDGEGALISEIFRDSAYLPFAAIDAKVDANGKYTGGTFVSKSEDLVLAKIAKGYEAIAQGTTPETYKVQEPTVEEPIVIDIDPPEEGGKGETVPVTVTQDLVREILGKEAAALTEAEKAQVKETLEATDEAGMKGWQKYAAGFSQTDKHPLAPKGKGGENGQLVLVTSLIQPKQLSVDTGVKVKYVLLTAPKTAVDPATGLPPPEAFEPYPGLEPLDTPEFPVGVAGLEDETYWKIEVVYTATKQVQQ